MIRLVIRYCLLLLSLPPVALQAAPWTVYDARAAAMGGAVVASSSRFASVHNMALAGRSEEFVDWYMAVPTGGEEIWEVGDLAGTLNRFGQTLSVTDLYRMRDQSEHSHEYLGLVVTVPSDVFGAGGFLVRSEYLGARANIGVPDTTDPFNIIYNSTIEKRVVQLTEHGLGFAQFRQSRWWLPDNTIIGITPKLVLARTMVSREPVESANLVYSFTDDETMMHSAFNVDFSLMREYSRFTTLGLSIRNLVPMSFDYADNSVADVKINPMVRAGMAYQRSDLSLAMDFDLSTNEEIAFSDRSRYLAAGGEYILGSMLAARAGIRMNLAGEQDVVVTYGLGLDYHGHVADVAAWSGEGINGIAAHLDLRF